jgi:glycosyltransferase involved in cell wall biosynthesis
VKLSVSVVTYQEVAYVGQALESVLAQRTDFPFEVVVGDDASTDGTRELLLELQRRWPDRLRLLLADANYGDRGLTNFMATVDACRGEFVAFLDGDDHWTDPEKLQRQVEFLEAHPECALCGHRVEHRGDDGHRELSRRPARGDRVYPLGELLVENFVHKISTVARRAAIATLPDWYRTTRVASADWVFNVLVARGGQVGFIDRVMAVHRKRGAGLAAYYGMPRMLSDRLAAFESLRPYFPDDQASIARGEQLVRWKLRIARFGPRAYAAARRLRWIAD